jgi:hypothetical protein
MPQLLYPQAKSPWCTLDRRVGGTQSWSGLGGEEKNSQPLPRLEPPIIQSIAQRYTTELSSVLSERNTTKIHNKTRNTMEIQTVHKLHFS